MTTGNSKHDLLPSSQAGHLVHPKYRPDIDGLRAIAVLAVVGFHAFPNWVRGGFVGVDVFFVISGFLISTIILSSLDRNSFSFTEFYSRRIRRIFPDRNRYLRDYEGEAFPGVLGRIACAGCGDDYRGRCACLVESCVAVESGAGLVRLDQFSLVFMALAIAVVRTHYRK